MLPDLPPPGPDGRYSAEQMAEYGLCVGARAVTICSKVSADADGCMFAIQRELCTDKEKFMSLTRLQGYLRAHCP